MTRIGANFCSTWVVIVAVEANPGEPSTPVAVVAGDLISHSVFEIGMPQLASVRQPQYPTGPRTLIVSIAANEVAAFHQALSWRLPERIVDLLVEHRVATNGRLGFGVGGFAGALLTLGCSTTGALAMGSSLELMRGRLNAVATLFTAMRPSLDLGRALLRGRYMCAVADIEATGIPVDQNSLAHLVDDWQAVRRRVVESLDRDHGVTRGGRLDRLAFEKWLKRRGIAWPRLWHGSLDLGNDAFREMARAYPEVLPLKELITTLHVDPGAITVGRDGRNRTPLRPFASRTGRNQPSTRASVLGSAAWVRHLIKPAPGTGLAMLDWEQQEFGIAAALSRDPAMRLAYSSGDPYLAFAIAAGAVPTDATADSHASIRDRFKICALGVQNGMGPVLLARLSRSSLSEAEQLLDHHRRTFSIFWSWRSAVETHALLFRELNSVFGWRLAVGPDANPRGLGNFPMQANGAEMLRLACCLVAEAGIKICAPNHDALLIEAPLAALDDAIADTERCMAEASALVLDGLALRTSVRVVRAPDRWTDRRGQVIWSAIEHTLVERRQPVRERHASCASANPRPISYYVSKDRGSHGTD